jgi:inactivated superfamily I helicase
MMKKISGMFMLVLAFTSCKQQADYKATRDQVIKVHDVVMADHGKVVDQQLKLGEMLKNMSAVKANNPQLDTLKEKDSISVVRDRLNVAEEAMNTWMHEFEPDVTGKSNDEAVAYFEAEKLKIQQVDSLFKAELKRAEAYLSKFKK